MTPLEAAKALAARGFTPWEDSCHLTCEMCGADGAGEDGPFPHAPDCPWLQRFQIVAALEAAERFMEIVCDRPLGDGWYEIHGPDTSALKAALKPPD